MFTRYVTMFLLAAAVLLGYSGCDFLLLAMQENQTAHETISVANPSHPDPGHLTFKMVKVPAGRTLVMENSDSIEIAVEMSDDFWMAEHEVTQGLWEKVMWSTDTATTWNNLEPQAQYGVGPDHPAYFISWEQALVFCNKLTELDVSTGAAEIVYFQDSALTIPYAPGAPEAYADWSKTGYRLPTDEEWEYAARYVDGPSLWTPADSVAGNNSPQDVTVDSAYAWFKWDNNFRPTAPQPVGLRRSSALGLFDMSGNLAEWCWDLDLSVLGSGRRIVRGGAYSDRLRDCAAGSRKSYVSTFRWNSVGLRFVRMDNSISP